LIFLKNEIFLKIFKKYYLQKYFLLEGLWDPDPKTPNNILKFFI